MHDWIIIGGGISGISISEVLLRNKNAGSVLLVDQHRQLAAENSCEFHEWYHTGALYSLLNFTYGTTNYLIGSIDDGSQFYKNFKGYNLKMTESGVSFDGSGSDYWFDPDPIIYRMRNRFWNPVWFFKIFSVFAVCNIIRNHDFMRRRSGEIISFRNILRQLSKFKYSWAHLWKRYIDIKSTDFTMKSRTLLRDILASALGNGLECKLNAKVAQIHKKSDYYEVMFQNGKKSIAKKVVICSPELLSELGYIEVSKSYSPMIICETPEITKEHFVELDYYPQNCINLLRKDGNISLVGGISFSNLTEANSYVEKLKHRMIKEFGSRRILSSYISTKKEIKIDHKDRNYNYHIQRYADGVYGTVLGKFTAFQSLAPEFYRQIFGENPSQLVDLRHENVERASKLIAIRRWQNTEK